MYGRRVHMVPVGDDVDRMVGPAVEMRADVVYLLAHVPGVVDGNRSGTALPEVDWDETESVRRYRKRLAKQGFETVAEAVERLWSRGIEAPVEFVDQTDVYAVLGLVTTLSHLRPEDDDVVVNASTGTRLATVGAALAHMDEDTDVEAYHVPADGVADRASTEDVADIPDYHIESPTRDELAAMAVVATRDTAIYTTKKSDLIDWGLRLRADAGVSIGYADRIVRSKRDRDPDSEPPARFDDLNGTGKKGAYRTLRTQVLEELVARDYVAIDDEQVGRADLLTLTPTGTAALRAFRHKILDVVEALEDHRDVDTLPPWLSQGLYGES